jgi:hypothetical protein
MLPGPSNPSPYNSRGSTPSTLRHRRSTVSAFARPDVPGRHAAWTDRTSPASAFDPATSSSCPTPWAAARSLSAASSGAADSFDRGSARHNGLQRCSPVAGSRPRNIARTCSAEASPWSPLVLAASPMNRPGDSPLPEKYSSRSRAIWSSQ